MYFIIIQRKIIKSNNADITCIGEVGQSGTYLLRIQVLNDHVLSFGRFKKGKEISIQAREYLYIGSALAKKGATTLGNRLSRHLSRTNGIDHLLRNKLQTFFDDIGIKYTSNPSPKQKFWNIDHLNDLSDSEVIGIIFIRSPKALENTWSRFLEADSDTEIFEKGLGANDSNGATHIQQSRFTHEKWKQLPTKLPITSEWK